MHVCAKVEVFFCGFRLAKGSREKFSNPNSISMTFSIKSNSAKRGEKDWKIVVGAIRDANTDGLNLVEKAKVAFSEEREATSVEDERMQKFHLLIEQFH